MKNVLFSILMLAGILFATSCSNDDFVDATLSLSETTTIQLANAACEKTITISTNQADWDAICGANWVILSKSGDVLTILTQENTTTTTRNAEILIVAGGATSKLTVAQDASDVAIVATPNAFEIDQWGGELKITVQANTIDWEVTSDSEWLTATPRQFNNEIILLVNENKAREDRIAKLIISGNENAGPQEVEIKQFGTLYYILPCLSMSSTQREVNLFELSRRSSLIVDYFYVNYGNVVYETQSPAFRKVEYKFNNKHLSEALLFASNQGIIMDPKCELMLFDAGFKAVEEDVYTKTVTEGEDQFEIIAQIVYDAPNGIQFNLSPKQTRAMPTFDALPFGFMDFTPTGTIEKLTAWETANGGTLDTEESVPEEGYFRFAVKDNPNKPTPMHRIYYFEETNTYLDQDSHVFANYEYAFFKAADGLYYFTDEFEALRKKHGFTDYIGNTVYGSVVLGGPNNKYEMFIGVKRWANILDKAPVLDIRFMAALPKKGNSTTVDNRKYSVKQGTSISTYNHGVELLQK